MLSKTGMTKSSVSALRLFLMYFPDRLRAPSLPYVFSGPPSRPVSSFVFSEPPSRPVSSFVSSGPPSRPVSSFVSSGPPPRPVSSFVSSGPPPRPVFSFAPAAAESAMYGVRARFYYNKSRPACQRKPPFFQPFPARTAAPAGAEKNLFLSF